MFVLGIVVKVLKEQDAGRIGADSAVPSDLGFKDTGLMFILGDHEITSV